MREFRRIWYSRVCSVPLYMISQMTKAVSGWWGLLNTPISRKVVGKSAPDSPKRYCGWFWVRCSSKKFERMAQEVVDVCLRVLKGSSKKRFDSYSVRNSVLIISQITFRDFRVLILPTTFFEIAVRKIGFVEIVFHQVAKFFIVGSFRLIPKRISPSTRAFASWRSPLRKFFSENLNFPAYCIRVGWSGWAVQNPLVTGMPWAGSFYQRQ